MFKHKALAVGAALAVLAIGYSAIAQQAGAPAAGRGGVARADSAWLRLQAVAAGSAASRIADRRITIELFKGPQA